MPSLDANALCFPGHRRDADSCCACAPLAELALRPYRISQRLQGFFALLTLCTVELFAGVDSCEVSSNAIDSPAGHFPSRHHLWGLSPLQSLFSIEAGHLSASLALHSVGLPSGSPPLPASTVVAVASFDGVQGADDCLCSANFRHSLARLP